MITKKEIINTFINIKCLVFFFFIFISQVNANTKVIAKNGDTLLKLSKQYGVSLKELMYKNNLNDANKLLEGEIIIIPFSNDNIDEYKNQSITYKVKKGDTLYKIARDYNVRLKDIISINRLDRESYLKQNQIIFLPVGALKKEIVNQQNTKLASSKVYYHKTSRVGEELSKIAKIHNVPIKDIIILNKLKDPISLSSNTKLKIRKTVPQKWLKYGSIIINWSDWSYKEGNYITQAKNKKSKPFYIAINCEKRSLNNSLVNSKWTNWYFPYSDFEFELISDFCNYNFEV